MTAEILLQHLALPEPGVGTEDRLYLRPHDALHQEGGALGFDPGGIAAFDAWVNLFNLTNWQAHCALDGLWLRLEGGGRLSVELRDFGTEQCLYRQIHDLSEGAARLDLAPLMPRLAAGSGLLSVRLVALTPARLDLGAFVTRATHARPVRLAVSITTFAREAAVARTVARLEDFLKDSDGETHVFVVDNGQSAGLAASTHVTPIPNLNLGGAGGFARGLAAAQAGGFTHCLFMDDDASFGMENLVRTRAFLGLARDPRAALAGAMISAHAPWALWENGAVFDGVCRPQFGGTDLRDPASVLALELAGAGAKPAGFYGGWWYFAFPVEGLAHHPYPFFVRGDDSAFSLSNEFAFATLNGVVSFQDDFGAKETPLVHYLDMRYHLLHPLVHEGLGIGKGRGAFMAARLIGRQMLRMHYASAAAQLQAWRDVMAGPGFFEANADMAAKRAEIGAIGKPEAWQPAEDLKVDPLARPPMWYAQAMRASLNGHLIPFFGLFGRKVRVDLARRAFLWPLWGARAATFVDADAGRSYSVAHSKRRFFGLLWQLFQCLWRWNRDYSRLKQAHQQGYARMASPGWWRALFAKGPAPLE